jgi:integrase
MNEENAITTIVTSTNVDLLVYAWLDAKFYKSTSEKTRKAYIETLSQFRGLLSSQRLDLDSDPARVALVAQVYAGYSTRGRNVAPATYNQRLAILSSCYAYAKKQGPSSPLYLEHNLIDTLDRAKVQEYAGAQPLEGEVVAEAMASIDQAELAGKRDYALLSTLLQTGRRAQEVANLTWGNVSLRKGRATLTFTHTKGNEIMIDELPAVVTDALFRWLHSYYGRALGKLMPESPLWVSLARDSSHGKQLGYLAITEICKKHLGTSKVHATRHTFAHTMEKIGAPVSEIQARLGHKSLATTGRYLASLKRAENRHGDQLAALFGIE